jgi:hypothetical protein
MIARLEGDVGQAISLQPAFSGFSGSARKPAAGRIARPTLKNAKCPPESEHLTSFPALAGRCTWENQIRRFRNRQNLYVIVILGRARNDVKEKTSGSENDTKAFRNSAMERREDSSPKWKNCEEP